MNILILSDSHGRCDLVAEAVGRVRPDIILFAGDGLRDLARTDLPCPVYAVRGNCDLFSMPIGPTGEEPSDEALFELDGLRILLMHGHRFGVKGGLGTAISHAVAQGADVLVFGHTHLPLELYLSPGGANHGYDIAIQKPLWAFNPGSLGDRGHTFGTLTVQHGQPLFGHGEL